MNYPHEYHNFGGIWPLGVSTSQSWFDVGAILNIIQTEPIEYVLEIGTQHGGLSVLLMARASYVKTFDYDGIEINEQLLDPRVPRSHIRIADAWSEDTVAWAHSMITSTQGKALILCDGGDKPRDLRTYAPLIREGDIIAAHDFTIEIQIADFLELGPDYEEYYPPYMAPTHWYAVKRRSYERTRQPYTASVGIVKQYQPVGA